MEHSSTTQDDPNLEQPSPVIQRDAAAGSDLPSTAALAPAQAPEASVPSSPPIVRPAKPRRKGGSGPFRRRRIKRLILGHCAPGPSRLVELTKVIARGTLYRHVDMLLKEGALTQQGRAYVTTAEGQQWLVQDQTALDWSIFDRIYPPLSLVPTTAHKALLELILAAAIGRRAAFREDHLCAFAAMGRTLRWKTSCGRMACAMLGVDPQLSVIELASEAGKSLFVRRTYDGRILSQRNILSSELAVIDDYLQASEAMRATVWPLLSGRRSIPFENGVLTVNCTTLLTLNPRPKPTLEEQTGLNPAQLRRLLLCDFNAVPMPNLSLTGHQAVEAAQSHGPLVLPPLRTDLQAHRPAFVRLVRQMIRPEYHDRVDSEMLLNLAAGMTGFLEDDERAIQQTAFDVGVLMTTLGWTMPDWLTVVSQFSLSAKRHVFIPSPPPQPATGADPVTEDNLILRRRLMDQQPKTDIPPFSLSDAARARFIWISIEESVSYADAVDILTDYYCAAKRMGLNLDDFHSILKLSKELDCRSIAVRDVRFALALWQYLAEHQLGVPDLDLAVHLLKQLQHFGLTPEDGRVASVLEAACKLEQSGVSLAEVEDWLASRNHPAGA